MTKKKKIVLTVALGVLVVLNIFFLCCNFCGEYSGKLPDRQYLSDIKTRIVFYNNTCQEIETYQSLEWLNYGSKKNVSNTFYYIDNNNIVLEKSLHSRDSNSLVYKRESIFKIILVKENVELFSTTAIVIQVIFSSSIIFITTYLIYCKIKEKKVIKNSKEISRTEL